jgi:N-acetylglucosaminyl-diphospho-decaprenol L-rhamnosyltransferase
VTTHAEGGATVDAVVVSYNSGRTIRRCVEPLLAADSVRMLVIDNDSRDDTLAAIAGLPLEALPQSENRGFAHGCNAGIEAGAAPYVLLLNPDAVIELESVQTLVRDLEEHPRVGIVAPRILDAAGSLEFSQRRFPRLRSTFAVAVFAHRLFPGASWQDEVIRDTSAYERPGAPPWVSGACLLVRRSVCEALGGLDDGFFLYGEDVDFCRRTRDLGYDIRFQPSATVMHIGGSSAPRPELLPLLAASRLRYSRKHEGRLERRLTRLGVALGAFTHLLLSRGGRRRGHARALLVALAPGNLDDPAAVATRALTKEIAT